MTVREQIERHIGRRPTEAEVIIAYDFGLNALHPDRVINNPDEFVQEIIDKFVKGVRNE